MTAFPGGSLVAVGHPKPRGRRRHPAVDKLNAADKARLSHATQTGGKKLHCRPQGILPIQASRQRLASHLHAVNIGGQLLPRRCGQVHRESQAIPDIGLERSVELSSRDTDAVGGRAGGIVADIKFGVIARMIERVSLKQSPPLATARGRVHHVHDQGILVDELAAPIRHGPMPPGEALTR